MKETKFIELLNLYVDHQISPAEAEQLETEVRSNPEHRRVYRDYCQMQKACTELAENFRTQAPAGNPQVARQGHRRRAAGNLPYALGLVAVAASLALVVGLRSRFAERPMVAAPVAPAVAPATLAVSAPDSRPVLQPVMGPRLLPVRSPSAELTEVASATDQAAFADWMNSVQLSSMPDASADDLRFDAHATLQPDARPYRSNRPHQGKVEWTAFTFQK
jgi:anti-sigma factor RsiW